MLQQLFMSFFFMGVTLYSISQTFEEKDFTRLTIKNGLVDNYITSIEQDENGYIWVGSDVGLCLYDGNSFSNYSYETANRQLLSQRIVHLKKITPHHIGIIGRAGFQVLNTKDFTVQNFTIPDTTRFTYYLNNPWDAKLMANGSFAVSTSTGFYVFDKTGKLNFRYDGYKLNDIDTKTLRYGRDIFSVSDHEYLVYLELFKVAYYNSEKKIYRVIDSSESAWSFFTRPSAPIANQWITKYQLSPHEFIFINEEKDTIVYYDHATKKTIASVLPFSSNVQELTFESKITKLNDSVFVLNGGSRGFWLLTLDRKTGQITCDGKKYLGNFKINCLFVDKENRLWAGTPEGLLQQKLNKPFLNVYAFDPLSLNDNLTGAFNCAYRYKNYLYLGRYSRYTGLIMLDTGSMKLIKIYNFYGAFSPWNEVRSIQMYHPDTLWIGTNAGFLWFDTKTEQYGKIADDNRMPDNTKFLKLNMSSATGKDGYAWFWAFLEGEAARYHPATNTIRYFNSDSDPALPFTRLKKISTDSYGDVWLSGHSLAKWNSRKEIFDTLMLSYGGTKKFNDNMLMLSPDDNGSLWLYNDENGLLQYIINEKKFVQYNIKDGLLSDNLESLSPVINNSLWIAYRAQLQNFNIHTKKLTTYGPWIGSQHKPTVASIYYDSSGNACYLFCKNDLIKFSSIPPAIPPASNEILLQKIIINNSKTLFTPGNDVKLKPGENSLAIYYTVIDFESGADFIYTYKLNSAETWTQIGNQHYITLTDLPSGNYLLQLKAMAKSGQEVIKEFSFYIAPPFWKTIWFYVLVFLLLAGIAYYLHRRRITHITQKANIDKLLAQTEMKALHSQMNPHFIFNCLNSIREMILNNENEQASLYLSKFARLIRITLNHSSKPFVSLEDTIDYLQRYLEMEQIRKSNFRYTIDVDENLQTNEILLPPMLIQPFIENAIWHGSSAGKEMNLTIHFKRKEQELVCIVDDNGIGIDASLKNKEPQLNYQSVGISNIKQRIHVLNEKYNLKSTIDIKDKSGLPSNGQTGTIVTLHLPIKTSESQ
jgi:ligand-binding sensor domain-containing protein